MVNSIRGLVVAVAASGVLAAADEAPRRQLEEEFFWEGGTPTL